MKVGDKVWAEINRGGKKTIEEVRLTWVSTCGRVFEGVAGGYRMEPRKNNKWVRKGRKEVKWHGCASDLKNGPGAEQPKEKKLSRAELAEDH